MWSRDGTELFYENREQMIAVSVSTEGGFEAHSREVLFEGNFVPFVWRANFDVHPDGQQFVLLEVDPEDIEITLNWVCGVDGNGAELIMNSERIAAAGSLWVGEEECGDTATPRPGDRQQLDGDR